MTLSKQTLVLVIGFLFGLSLLSALDWEFLGLENHAEPLSKAVSKTTTPSPSPTQNTCRVVHVFDGDTLECQFEATALAPRRREHIRLLGIDAPESKHSYKNKTGVDAPFALAASKRLKQLTLGQTVRLEYDIRPYDRYGRTLAYVFVPTQAKASVNERLVQEGLVVVRVIPPNIAHESHYNALEKQAKRAQRGLWGKPE